MILMTISWQRIMYENLKKIETLTINRTKTGHYRCETLYYELYITIKEAESKYSTPIVLVMLQHPYSTQQNEAVNQAAATLANENILKDFVVTYPCYYLYSFKNRLPS